MRKFIIIAVLFFGVVMTGTSQTVRKVKVTELEQIVKEATQPTIINFWATFCKPCIEEMPHFQEAAVNYKSDSLRLILVSLDLEETYPKGILAFLKKRPVDATIFWLDEFDADYFCPKVDPKWSGAIPATLFINNKNGYRSFFEEQLSREKLSGEIAAMLGK